ncbi:MAG: hypothetical protein ACXV2D_03945 [Halobacteriota archaeon]
MIRKQGRKLRDFIKKLSRYRVGVRLRDRRKCTMGGKVYKMQTHDIPITGGAGLSEQT